MFSSSFTGEIREREFSNYHELVEYRAATAATYYTARIPKVR
jgi:hypothetical protein